MNYISAAIHVNKFLSQTEVATTLRQVQKQVKKLIRRFRPPTTDELTAMERWLPWEDVIKMCESLKKDYQEAEEASKTKAVALMKYLMIAFYCYFPPVRAGPIRQLELDKSLVFKEGKWHLDLRKYKTYKQYGPLITVSFVVLLIFTEA